MTANRHYITLIVRVFVFCVSNHKVKSKERKKTSISIFFIFLIKKVIGTKISGWEKEKEYRGIDFILFIHSHP